MQNTTKGYKMSYLRKNLNQDGQKRKSLGNRCLKRKKIKNTNGIKKGE